MIDNLVRDLDTELKIRDLRHEMELIQFENKLHEYVGLKTEREIRIEEDLLRAVRGFKLIGLEKWGYKEPPNMRRIMPKATTDWDFCTTYWNLDTSIYVSAPSSLRVENVSLIDNNILCKYTGTYPLDQGRIVTQVRIVGGSVGYTFGWVFRVNRPAGSNCVEVDRYWLHECQNPRTTYDPTRVILGYNLTTSFYNFQSEPYLTNGAPPFDSWDLRRITWWISGVVMMFRLERYYGGAWIKAINDISDTNNRFTGNPNRRCGFGGGYARDTRIDNTEIWGT